MLTLEGRVLRRQIVHDDAQRLTLNPEHGLHRVGVGHHVALPQPFRQFKARRPKADRPFRRSTVSTHLRLVSPSAPSQASRCTQACSCPGQHPVVVQASLPTVVAVHAVVVCQVDLGVVASRPSRCTQAPSPRRPGPPTPVTLGAVVQFDVPGVDHHAVGPSPSPPQPRSTTSNPRPTAARLRPPRSTTTEAGCARPGGRLGFGLDAESMGRLHRANSMVWDRRGRDWPAHSGGQEGTQGHAARTQHLALSYKCMKAFLANRRSSLSSWSGSSTQQSTGKRRRTAARRGSPRTRCTSR